MDDDLGHLVVDVRNLLDEIVISLVYNIDIFLGDIGDFIGRSKLVAVRINDRFLVNDVELAFELVFPAKREQYRPGIRAEFL